LFGRAFELRVFIELFPVLFLAATAGWKKATISEMEISPLHTLLRSFLNKGITAA